MLFLMSFSLEMNLTFKLYFLTLAVFRLLPHKIGVMTNAFLVAGLNPFFDKKYVISGNIGIIARTSDTEIFTDSDQVLHCCLVFLC